MLVAILRSRGLAALLLLASACRRDVPATPDAVAHDPPAQLRVETVARVGGIRLTLVPAFGVRINARVVPALELASGDTVRLGDASLTEDGDYFADPPAVTLPHPLGPRGTNGVIRASVCEVGARICRSVRVPL